MLTVVTLLWQPNAKSQSFSRMYTPEWADRLFRGFSRNLIQPFRFVCLVDRDYDFAEPIEQVRITADEPDYGTCIEAYSFEGPSIIVGLDTVITGNIDHLADWARESDRQGLPRDPYMKTRACNGVALVPPGWTEIHARHNGENDMEWVRGFPHAFIDDEFPGQVVSYKGHVKQNGLGDARIVYFHGAEKPHQLADVAWIGRHWR